MVPTPLYTESLQEEVMNRYASCQDELLMFSYLCGTVYVSSFCLFTGDLYEGAVFLRHEVRVGQRMGKT